MSKVVIDKEGKIEIPPELQKECSFQTGMELELLVEGDSLRLQPLREPDGKLVWEEGVPVFYSEDDSGISVEMVNQAIEATRVEREQGARGGD